MLRSRAPNNLWEFYLTQMTDNHSPIDQPIYKLCKMTTYEILTRDTLDLLEFVEYDCYASF